MSGVYNREPISAEDLYEVLKEAGTKIIIRSDEDNSLNHTKVMNTYSPKNKTKSVNLFLSNSSHSLNSSSNAHQVKAERPLKLHQPPRNKKESQYLKLQLLEDSH